METLGNKRLSAILSLFIRIVWWIEWIGAILITVAIIITSFFKKEVSFNAPVTFSTQSIKNFAAIDSLQQAHLNSTNGNFTFPVDCNLINISLMLLIVATVFAFFILGTYQLKLIFSSFEEGIPFVALNFIRIRNIGFILILYTLMQLFYNIALNQYIISHFKLGSDIGLTFSLNFGALVTGVTMIIITEIFKLGTLMDNERKLTI